MTSGLPSLRQGPRSTGRRGLQLRIGDIGFDIRSDADGPSLYVPLGTRKFEMREGHADVVLRASWGDLSGAPGGRRLFDSGGLWQLFDDDGYYVFRFATPILQPHPYKIARFTHDFSRGEIILHRAYFDAAEPLYPLEYPLDELLTIQLLAQGRGIEVHACGVVDGAAGGLLFVGVSGAGKSTMGLQWSDVRGVHVLSDDRIILRRVGREILMYGTPWHGEAALARSGAAVLKKVFFLKQGPDNRSTGVPQTAAIARLLGCAFFPFHSPGGIDAGFTVLADVTAHVPCRELTFAPDPRVVSFVRAEST